MRSRSSRWPAFAPFEDITARDVETTELVALNGTSDVVKGNQRGSRLAKPDHFDSGTRVLQERAESEIRICLPHKSRKRREPSGETFVNLEGEAGPEQPALPIRTVTSSGARVAPQRCPTLRGSGSSLAWPQALTKRVSPGDLALKAPISVSSCRTPSGSSCGDSERSIPAL
jgi:hypothetical protein